MGSGTLKLGDSDDRNSPNRGATRVSKIKKMAWPSWKGTRMVSKNGLALLEGNSQHRGPQGFLLKAFKIFLGSTPLSRKGPSEDNCFAVWSPFWLNKGPPQEKVQKSIFPLFCRLLASRGHFYSLAEAY